MRPYEWRAKSRKANLETKISAIKKELSEAESAVATRRKELSQQYELAVEVEREALDDAAYSLEGLRTALTHRSEAA
jgi:hypothetical protein